MSNNVYKIIDKNKNKCTNAIVWDGIDNWTPPDNCDVIQSDIINIGDDVQLISGSWEKVSN